MTSSSICRATCLCSILRTCAWSETRSQKAAPIADPFDFDNPNVVKPVMSREKGKAYARALYFSRSRVPSGAGDLYHHIGIYAFRRHSLAQFVSLPPSPLETRENLEQLRALEHGMSIAVGIVEKAPLSVDTPADLERALAAAGRGSVSQ